MFRRFYKEVERSLQEALEKNNWEADDLKIEEPREIADLATAVSFELSSKTKKEPFSIAKALSNKINEDDKKYINKVEAEEPGYVNFYFNKKILSDFINEIIKSPTKFGEINQEKEKIIIEHTSANPTGPLHIGHLRNAVIGDTLKRILDKSGYETTTQYYLNDLGKQMALLLLGVQRYGIDEEKPPDVAIGEIYSKVNSKKEDIEEEEIENIIHGLENKDEELKEKLDDLVEKCFSGMENSLRKLNIELDEVVKESRFVFDGSVEEVYQELSEYVEKEDGASQINFGEIDKELVLKRKDGSSVYALRDLAYHKWKSSLGKNIDILGSDHKLYSRQLKKALKLLDVSSPEVIIFEFVSLPEGEMSSRKGKFVSIDELIKEVEKKAYEEVDKRREGKKEWKRKIANKVAVAAVKYNFISVAPNKPIKFNLKKAVSFKEQGAPFIQYSYARASGILEKSDNKELGFDYFEKDVSIELATKLAKYTYVLEKSAIKRKPHLFAEYLFELASKFNEFYRDVPVLDSEGKLKKNRLSIVKATKIALKDGIETLGFEAPEEM